MTKARELKMKAAQELVLKIKNNCKAPIIARDAVGEVTGGACNARTLSNHDSAGTGPRGRFYIGRRAVYPVEAFCDWLVDRISLEPCKVGKYRTSATDA